MLYTEFLAGTKAREDSKTYEQYQTIERIYNDCEDMTKEDAYKIWKQTYGKQQQKDRARELKRIQAMSEYRSKGGEMTPEEIKIRRTLLQTVVSVAETNQFQGGWDAEITNPDGVTYRLEKYNTVNGHGEFRLLIRYEGKTYPTAAIWSFGDARIHATPGNLPKIA